MAGLFSGVEVCYYWMHRAGHRIRWFWLNHAVHHSPGQYTPAPAYRLGWTGQVNAVAVCFALLVWLGDPVPVVIAAALNLTDQFCLHTESIGTLPRWVEGSFSTPAHHHAHHARNPEYLDCNHGGVLVVFDRLFGAFRKIQPGVPLRYGLVEPVRIACHAWLGMFADLRPARSPKQVRPPVFGPPGCKPGG